MQQQTIFNRGSSYPGAVRVLEARPRLSARVLCGLEKRRRWNGDGRSCRAGGGHPGHGAFPKCDEHAGQHRIRSRTGFSAQERGCEPLARGESRADGVSDVVVADDDEGEQQSRPDDWAERDGRAADTSAFRGEFPEMEIGGGKSEGVEKGCGRLHPVESSRSQRISSSSPSLLSPNPPPPPRSTSRPRRRPRPRPRRSARCRRSRLRTTASPSRRVRAASPADPSARR